MNTSSTSSSPTRSVSVSSSSAPNSRNEIKIPIVKEDPKVKSNEIFITNVTVMKPPISPSRSSSKELNITQGHLSNERFVTESSEMVTYKDGEVVDKKIVEK